MKKGTPHGTRSRYVNQRCRCLPCRAAQNEYQRDRIAKVRAGTWLRPVSTRRVRQHLFYLSSRGVGRRTVSDITGLSMRVLADYKRGRTKRLSRENERLILAVTKKALYDRKLVPVTNTENIVRKLLREGFMKSQIATRAGISPSVLSKRKGCVFARTEMKIEQFYNRVTAGGCCMKFQHSIYQLSKMTANNVKETQVSCEMRGQQPNAGEMFLDLNNPEPVFRDQINSLLRVGNASKVFGWKIGF